MANGHFSVSNSSSTSGQHSIRIEITPERRQRNVDQSKCSSKSQPLAVPLRHARFRCN